MERQDTSAEVVRERVEVAVRMAFVNEALSNIKERIAWTRVADVCETGGRIIAGVATILAFASSTYKEQGLSFASGCVGTVSVTVSVFGAYAQREARERLTRLNAVLRDVNVREISDTPPLGND
jgi:acid phosphatase family membrane protein YuiD